MGSLKLVSVSLKQVMILVQLAFTLYACTYGYVYDISMHFLQIFIIDK